MKQSLPTTSRNVRKLASAAGVLAMTLVAVPPAARAGEFRTPHEVLFSIHQHVRNHILHVIDHAVMLHDGYRHADGPRYLGPVYVPGYERPVYRHRAEWTYGGYAGRPYIGGYVAIPQVVLGYSVRPGVAAGHDGCGRRARYDRDGYRNNDRHRRDDRYDEDHD